MAVFIIDGVAAPLVTYNFKDTMRAIRGSDLPDKSARIAAAAGGFMASPLTAEMLDDDRIEFTEEEKKFLLPHIGSGLIWVEENTYTRYPVLELRGILLHEEAHIVYRDIYQPGAVGIIENQEFEIRADAYAASKVGKKVMAKALRRTMFLVAEKRFGRSQEAWDMAREILECPEALQRLDALK